MKYKVSKEELDALFREVYSSSTTSEDYYISSPLKRKDEYKFLAYKYKNTIKSFLISHLPFRIYIKNFSAFEGKTIPQENFFISGYDIEKKYRLYITVNENFGNILSRKSSSDIHKLTGEKFNIQGFIENLSENLIQHIKRDFPFLIKKISSSDIQFYGEEFIKLEYKIELENSETEISLWIEKPLLEACEISPIVFSPPTSQGKKKLKALKDLINVEYTVLTKPIEIQLNQLKLNNEIDVKLEIKEIIG